MMLINPSLSLVYAEKRPLWLGASDANLALCQLLASELVSAAMAISSYEVLP
jgi:hypothetical protein